MSAVIIAAPAPLAILTSSQFLHILVEKQKQAAGTGDLECLNWFYCSSVYLIKCVGIDKVKTAAIKQFTDPRWNEFNTLKSIVSIYNI